ncbi:hypothetical protein Ais01nite_83860 [Asanoa ishikariensis]|uniref:RNA polymerase-binding protein n=1 Tax=Asanoa ishikariensis TaxID=137265 RepID=A0A1H3KGF4_9ACTN|nr:hypothetical protein Ais01nite_83860 [Asanoa ishikariensis]SDY51227.1 RNA polymerase-binding protein [Asanoa ishikariensis]
MTRGRAGGVLVGVRAAAHEHLCAKGHQFEVPFAVDAEVPMTWESKFGGSVARLVDGVSRLAANSVGGKAWRSPLSPRRAGIR